MVAPGAWSAYSGGESETLMYDVGKTAADALAALGLRPAAVAAVLAAWPDAAGLSRVSAGEIRAAVQSRGARLGKATADRVVAAFALARAGAACHDRVRTMVRDPRSMAAYVRAEIGDAQRETFLAVWLDSRCRVLATTVVAIGTVSQVDVHPREVFRPGMRIGAHSVIVAHNHPSGDAEPSSADFELTGRLADVGRLIGIPLLDHLVVTARDFVSLAATGAL